MWWSAQPSQNFINLLRNGRNMIDSKLLHPIDFEYNHKDNKFINPVCVAIDDKTFWLLNDEQTNEFKEYLSMIEGEILISHASSLAEIPCCMVLGIEPEKYVWFDTMCTEKRLQFFIGKGEQGYSLLETLQRYGLAHSYSKEQKEDLRNLIINGDCLEYRKFEILDYCAEDIAELKQLATLQIQKLEHQLEMDYKIDVATLKEVKDSTESLLNKFIGKQSTTNITTARMYFNGFDVDYNKIKQLSDPRLIYLLKQNLNTLIPGVFNEFGIKKDDVVRDFIMSEDSDAFDWFKYHGYLTPSDGKISLKNDYLSEYLSEHKGISDKLDTFRQVSKVIKASAGFQKEGDSNWITPNLFSDGMHCNASEFGTVTTRYTPKPSKGWIPGMGKALRGLLKPENKNEAYFALDFNAQEIWVIGQLSKDKKLLQTYESNDIYMSIAQNMGLYPQDLPIPTEQQRSEDWFKPYKKLRQKIKGMVLGLNYGMSNRSFAKRNNIDEVEASDLIEKYNQTYFKKNDWTNSITNYFENKGTLFVGSDVCIKHYNYSESKNKNKRQAMNYPVQCIGASITREALRLAFERGISPVFPVHDEIYFKTTLDKLENDVQIARNCMIDAAFNAIGNTALLKYPIKVGDVEVTTWNKVPKHSGGEETADLIDRNLLLLRTLPDNFNPFKTSKKKTKEKQQIKTDQVRLDLEGFYS